LCCKVQGQTYSTLISNQEIQDFFYELNASNVIHIHKLTPKIASWETMFTLDDTTNQEIPFKFLNKSGKEYAVLKAAFGTNDIKFLKEQFFALKDAAWDFTQMKAFIPADPTVNKEIAKKSQSGRRSIKDNYSYTFSVPMFSLDKKSVIIYQDYFCGFMCSTACIYLYQKNGNGKWKEIISWYCWSG
jgi:hypothetical protein